MIARFSGACLGLLAFSVAGFSGLYVGNPVSVTLSRCISSLLLFCVIGHFLGGAAQLVINEHRKSRIKEMEDRLRKLKEDAQGKRAELSGSAAESVAS